MADETGGKAYKPPAKEEKKPLQERSRAEPAAPLYQDFDSSQDMGQGQGQAADGPEYPVLEEASQMCFGEALDAGPAQDTSWSSPLEDQEGQQDAAGDEDGGDDLGGYAQAPASWADDPAVAPSLDGGSMKYAETISDTTDLKAQLEACRGGKWIGDDNEDGMFMLLSAASDGELRKLATDAELETWLSELYADDALELRNRVYGEGPQNIVARWKQDPWLGGQSGTYDAILAMPIAQRALALKALKKERLLDGLPAALEIQLETMCTGTEAEAVFARLQLATTGDGTDEEGVQTALAGAAQLLDEARALEDQKKAGGLTDAELETVQTRLDEIGGIQALLDGTKDTGFLQLAASEVSRDEMAAGLSAGGADEDLVAKQQILGAEGVFNDDQTAMTTALGSVQDDGARQKLIEDEQVDSAINPAWGGLQADTVSKLSEGDTYAVAAAELDQLASAMSPDHGAILKRIARMTEEERQQLANDGPLRAKLTAPSFGLGVPDLKWAQALDTFINGGSMPTDWLLEDTTAGGTDDSDLMEGAYAGMAEHDRDAVQLGYLLEKRGTPESEWSDDDREAMKRYKALSEPIGQLSDAGEQDEATRAMMGEQPIERLDDEPGRRALVDTFHFRQLDRMAVEGGGYTPTADQTLEIAHTIFEEAYAAAIGGTDGVTLAEATQLVALDQQFWDKAGAQAEANAYVAEMASSIAAASICVALAFVPGVGPAAAGSLYAALAGNAGLISIAAVLGGVAKVTVAEEIGGDFNDREEVQVGQFASGTVEVIAGVVGAHLAANVVGAVGLAGKPLAGHLAKGARSAAVEASAGRAIATAALEGAVDGAVGGAAGDLVMTAIDAETYKRGLWQVIGRYSTSMVEGAVLGAGTGGILGAGFATAGEGVSAMAGGADLAAAGGSQADQLAPPPSTLAGPAPAQTAPASGQAVPTRGQATPAPARSTPAPAQTNPAPSQTTPTPELSSSQQAARDMADEDVKALVDAGTKVPPLPEKLASDYHMSTDANSSPIVVRDDVSKGKPPLQVDADGNLKWADSSVPEAKFKAKKGDAKAADDALSGPDALDSSPKPNGYLAKTKTVDDVVDARKLAKKAKADNTLTDVEATEFEGLVGKSERNATDEARYLELKAKSEKASAAHGKMVEASEMLGDEAATKHMKSAHANAERIIHGSGKDSFDQVWIDMGKTPPEVIIVEAKGGSATNTSSRETVEGRAQQGSHIYAKDLWDKAEKPRMEQRADDLYAAGRFAEGDALMDRLAAVDKAVSDNKYTYIEVSQKLDDSGNLGTAVVREYQK